VAVYALLLTSSWLLPAEKTHLFYYGVLAWAAWRAWAFDLHGGGLFAATVVFVGVLGGIDEGIQHLLPERVFEWKDVMLNLLSGFLATCVVALFDIRGQGNAIAD
jgi:VanZ family protein